MVETQERSWRTWLRPFIVPGLVLSLVGWLLCVLWLALMLVETAFTLGVDFLATR